nr:MAG: 1-(5-phosphoribosyl)-5-[(5-phosphoribosylamino)methylideneamino] imidazole-4-carboxamide isomerase [Thermoproteus sp. AZ2]
MVIPSIDLEGGRAVKRIRGVRGRYIFVGNPLELAERFKEAPLVHIVDLDGAEAGRPVNAEVVKAVKAELNGECELGGGLRSVGAIEQALSLCEYAVVGTLPFTNPAEFERARDKFGDRLVVSIDVKGGLVMGSGWAQPLASIEEAAALLSRVRPAAVIYTAVDVEGTGLGPSLKYAELLRGAARRIYYAGGIADCGHLMAVKAAGFDGAIVGYALYKGNLSCVKDFQV